MGLDDWKIYSESSCTGVGVLLGQGNNPIARAVLLPPLSYGIVSIRDSWNSVGRMWMHYAL